MFNYLSIVTPDYSTTMLSIVPKDIIPDEMGRSLGWNITDSGNRESVIKSSSTKFALTLQYANLSVADSNTIMDLYLDTNKGAFGSRTIPWLHPLDQHIYVIRILNRLKRATRIGGFVDIQNLPISVDGYIS